MPKRAGRRRLPLIGAAIAIVALVLLILPPGPADTRPAARFTIAPVALARGVIHVHTSRSDGSGTVDEVAAAAAAAGLGFVILSDHGDGTGLPLVPAYRSGVLVIDGVEISTDGGHYVALGLGQAPYRLAGEAADVAADVRRLGGFGFAAHPDSPRAALAWRAWEAPIDGLEWFNLDSEWRDEGTPRLARALIGYPLRPVASVGLLVGDGGRLLRRWAGMAASRRVLGIAAVDAHARLGTEGGFDGAWINLRAPGYETLFATAQVGVELDAKPTGDAVRDAAALLAALGEGRFFSAITTRAPLGRLVFRAERGGVRARMGQFLGGSGPPVVTVEADAPRGVVTRIVCDGRTITQTLGDTFSRVLDEEGVRACQAVLGWPGSSADAFVVWAISNPIYFRAGDAEPDAVPPVAARGEVLAAAASSWGVEHAPGSTARVERLAPAPADPHPATPVRLDYALAPGARASQYAALVSSDIGTLSWARWLRLTLSADRPMRVSLQVREPSAASAPRRWQHSLVIGPEPSTHIVAIADLAPIAPAVGPPPVTQVRSILLVVDTVNTPPGRRGQVVVHEIRAEAP
jgi:hypothetical protein